MIAFSGARPLGHARTRRIIFVFAGLLAIISAAPAVAQTNCTLKTQDPSGWTPIKTLSDIKSPSGKYYLTGNMNAAGQASLYPMVFSGKFDGCGYTISNLSITASGSGAGLFGTLTGAFANVVFDKPKLTFKDPQGTPDVGLVAAKASGGKAIIQNVTLASPTISVGAKTGNAGGLIGSSTGDNAKSLPRFSAGQVTSGTLFMTTTDASPSFPVNYLGGILGKGYAVIETSVITGTILSATGDSQATVGGLVGGLYNDSSMRNSSADTTIKVTGNEKSWIVGGGIIGGITAATLDNTAARGTLTMTGQFASANAGGLIGGVNNGLPTGIANVSNSYSTVDIKLTATKAVYVAVGGLFGYALGTTSNVYSAASISANYGKVGVLVGDNYGTILQSGSAPTAFWVSDINGKLGAFGTNVSNSVATSITSASLKAKVPNVLAATFKTNKNLQFNKGFPVLTWE